jgi:hypothetical protein
MEEIKGECSPFWLMVSGGKRDYTIKWWDRRRYQQVVDHFRGRIEFVQVGESGHYHPALDGVVDLRGQTDLRQLVRLVYHAQGVLTPVSLLMHLAAAVETRPGLPANRPCVVLAGGREPPHWEAYPSHQFIHTVGALKCCDLGGCWKSRTQPLGDADEKDRPDQLCIDVVRGLPRCMDLIEADEVIRRIELYYRGGAVEYPNEAARARTAAKQPLRASPETKPTRSKEATRGQEGERKRNQAKGTRVEHESAVARRAPRVPASSQRRRGRRRNESASRVRR